jgi:2-iminobutanoate/2-iminopropanoate deaminase
VGRRQTFAIPGVSHTRAPIPMAARVGSVLQTSAIMGKDPATSELPDDPVREVEFCFVNAKAILDAAGLTIDDIVYMDVFLKDPTLRDAVNEHWCAWYPEPDDRPARHTTTHELPFGMSVQLKFQAVFP